MSVSVSGLDPQEFDLTDLLRAWYHRGQKYNKETLFKNNCFGKVNFVKITKQSLYKANSFACSLANAATLQRECSGGVVFVIITKIITKIIVPRNCLVIVLARIGQK